MELTRLAADAGQFINRAVQVRSLGCHCDASDVLASVHGSAKSRCGSALVHGGESRPGGPDRAGSRAGGAAGPGRRHQDLHGQDRLSDRGFTAA